MTIPLDTDTSVKTTEKLTKYKDLEIEVEQMWRLKTTTVPLWLWEPLAPSRRTWKTEYSQKIPGNINIRELQKITLLSTAHAVIIISDNNLNLGLPTTDAASSQGGT